jgi:hypothetical protein
MNKEKLNKGKKKLKTANLNRSSPLIFDSNQKPNSNLTSFSHSNSNYNRKSIVPITQHITEPIKQKTPEPIKEIAIESNEQSVVIDPIKILVSLLKLILSPSVNSNTLIQYIEKHQIDPNTYLPSLQSDLQIPLIYYCCSNPNLIDFFHYLLDRNVNLNAQMSCNSDPSLQIELLYYSQIQYISTLIGIKLLKKGNINKLYILYKYNAIKKHELLKITQEPGLIFQILDHLYERIYTLCQQIKQEEKLNKLTNEIMKNYLNVFKLFFKNGVSVNQIDNNESFLQRVLNTYFFEVIELTINYQPDFDHVDFLHYSNFDLTNRQVMKIYYNDQTYEKILEYLKDKIPPQKINIKKPASKRIVKIEN